MLRSSRSFLAVACVLAAGTLASITTTANAQVGTAITYQGLLERNNVKVNTATDMRFTLFDAATGGNQVGNQVTASAQVISNGLFNVALDFGVNPYTADGARWMQIEVRNPTGTGSFVPMGARQKLTPSPFALATRGINVNANGRVGILTQPVDDSAAITLGTAGGQFPASSLRFRGDNGRLWDMSVFSGAGSDYGGFTISRSGLDFPFVIDGVTSNILLNQNATGGNVGIGTGTPASKLQVEGGNIFGRFVPAAASPNLLIGSPTATTDVQSSAIGFLGSGILNAGIGYVPSTAAGSSRMDFGFGGTSNPTLGGAPAMSLRANGGLGVGEFAQPTFAPLFLRAGTNNSLMELHNGAGAVRWNINVDAGGANGLQFSEANVNFFNMVLAPGGNVGIGIANPTFKLDVSGNIRCVALTQTSCRDLKQDIAPLSGGLEAIMKLNPVSYSWNDQAPEQVRGNHDIGFLADEMNEVLPDIVAKDASGKPVGIDYGKITPVAVEAIQQLKNENDLLKARLEKIEALLAAQNSTK